MLEAWGSIPILPKQANRNTCRGCKDSGTQRLKGSGRQRPHWRPQKHLRQGNICDPAYCSPHNIFIWILGSFPCPVPEFSCCPLAGAIQRLLTTLLEKKAATGVRLSWLRGSSKDLGDPGQP